MRKGESQTARWHIAIRCSAGANPYEKEKEKEREGGDGILSEAKQIIDH